MIMFIIFPRRYQLRRITVDGSSCRFLTYCCRFVFSTLLSHPPQYHHVVLFWLCSRRCLIGTVVASAFPYMPGCRGDLFLLYWCNQRMLTDVLFPPSLVSLAQAPPLFPASTLCIFAPPSPRTSQPCSRPPHQFAVKSVILVASMKCGGQSDISSLAFV